MLLSRVTRRDVRLPCQVVRERGFVEVGRHALDLSPDGMLVLADRPVLTGERVILTLKIPMGSRLFFDAEAVVARVVHGRRPTDRGRALGLSFTWKDARGGAELERHLAWFREARAARRLEAPA